MDYLDSSELTDSEETDSSIDVSDVDSETERDSQEYEANQENLKLNDKVDYSTKPESVIQLDKVSENSHELDDSSKSSNSFYTSKQKCIR